MAERLIETLEKDKDKNVQKRVVSALSDLLGSNISIELKLKIKKVLK